MSHIHSDKEQNKTNTETKQIETRTMRASRGMGYRW